MAVYAAHLTRTLQGTPSVFQVAAQEALGATIKPALRKLIEYVATVYPNKLDWTSWWFDELYLVLDLCLQYHYLKHYAASFSESFYGLMRVPLSPCSEFGAGPRLPAVLERASLALLVLVPYVGDKVEAVVERWTRDDDDGRLGKGAAARLRRAAARAHCAARAAAAAAALLQLARYLTGRARAPTPALALLGLALREAAPAAPPGRACAGLAGRLLAGDFGAAAATFPLLGGLLLRGAEYGAFAVQFLRWWESRGAGAGCALPPPPPPQRDERAARWKNKCPICLQTWKIPTVLPVSGYTFCYVCIARHVRAARACPVTRLPAAEAALVRLYVD